MSVSSIENNKRIEMLLEKDSVLREGKDIIDNFNVIFELFQPNIWSELEKEIDEYSEKKLKQRESDYCVKDIELEKGFIDVKRKKKITELYCIKNGIEL